MFGWQIRVRLNPVGFLLPRSWRVSKIALEIWLTFWKLRFHSGAAWFWHFWSIPITFSAVKHTEFWSVEMICDSPSSIQGSLHPPQIQEEAGWGPPHHQWEFFLCSFPKGKSIRMRSRISGWMYYKNVRQYLSGSELSKSSLGRIHGENEFWTWFEIIWQICGSLSAYLNFFCPRKPKNHKFFLLTHEKWHRHGIFQRKVFAPLLWESVTFCSVSGHGSKSRILSSEFITNRAATRTFSRLWSQLSEWWPALLKGNDRIEKKRKHEFRIVGVLLHAHRVTV